MLMRREQKVGGVWLEPVKIKINRNQCRKFLIQITAQFRPFCETNQAMGHLLFMFLETEVYNLTPYEQNCQGILRNFQYYQFFVNHTLTGNQSLSP